MLETKQQTFLGVRFILLGFDPINENKVRSKLVNGGGDDVGEYNQSCTHVIVDKLVYDDSVCVAARRDGKTLVTGLWVDHSFDIGVPVDPTSVLYRPLKDLNGILGAKSLIMCLTGYQRQDRDDIMTMVGLMGAQFSKPLVANKVTHLICYKFEGEKYELAKKMKKIKLVNHRWLEDCLRAWEILPEVDYSKSGYDLEMEAEAKDSEEEAEDIVTKQFSGENMNLSPYNVQTGMRRAHELPTSIGEVSKIQLDTAATDRPPNVVNENNILFTSGKETRSDQTSSLHNVTKKHPKAFVVSHQTCGELSGPCDRTPISTKVTNDMASTPRSSKRSPHSDVAKSSAISYTRKNPRRFSLQGEILSNVSSSPIGEFKVGAGSVISPSKIENAKDRMGSGCIKTPSKGTGLLHEEELGSMLPQKRKLDVSCASSKLQKMHDSKPCTSGSPLKPTSLINGPLEINNCLSLGSNRHPLDETASLNFVQNSSADPFRTKSLSINKKSLAQDQSLSKTVSSKIGQDSNAEKKAPQASFGQLNESNLASTSDIVDFGLARLACEFGERGEPQNQKQDVEVSSPTTKRSEFEKSHKVSSPTTKRSEIEKSHKVSSPTTKRSEIEKSHKVSSLNTKRSEIEKSHKVSSPTTKRSEIEKSHSPANLDLLKGGNNMTLLKPLVARKSLGSRPKLSTSHTTYQKGSIHFNRTTSQNDATICSGGEKETANFEKSSDAGKLEVVPPTVNVESVMETNTKNVPTTGNGIEIESMDDETEAPEDMDEHEFEKAVNEKSEVVELKQKVDTIVEGKSAVGQHITDDTNANIDHAMTSEEAKIGTKLGKVVCDKKIQLGKSTSKKDAASGKITKGKKRAFGKTKVKTLPDLTENMELKKGVDGEETQNNKSSEKAKTEERVPLPAGRTQSSTALVNKSENSKEVEKENKPIANEDQYRSQNKQGVEKVSVKSNKRQLKTKQKSGKIDPDSTGVGGIQKIVKTEPTWFILSGHQLQRKEFQKIIRHLKGRFCRDSHHWSYQATHFIVPDPIRRTEKFFAAVASGRWVLKTDYLTASSQAGKFLTEEPYEWHKNCLTEDGAINLEAPRKWRLLRERTGHGAFYGMRIIIYGECIAPPLDTLKRAVKAGDGTILATAPPYTRFLNSGADFAIVSPGMPRVDIWVQEFLRHKIPCVVADYLVEYVCKSGYSLEKHVQYNTHDWAEKSLANLLSRSEEIAHDLTPPENHDSDDLTCQVCGSSERGEVMLICGDESGLIGCGVGTHIDCCDPPLEEVPEEDWSCPHCSRSRNSTNKPKNTKKRTSSKSK